MDTQQVERELAALLHQRAETAMSRTNTQQAHRTFQSVVADLPRTSRRHWVLAAAAAAVVALAVGVTLWPSHQVADKGVPGVKGSDAPHAADVETAEGIAGAYAAHDTDLLAQYLDPELSPPPSEWSTEFKRDAAWGVDYLWEPCSVKFATSDETRIECPYTLHLLGSREVGEGPFTGNELTVVLRDGKVISAQTRNSWQWNGTQEHVESVDAWVAENHPKDAKLLRTDEQKVQAADWPRWATLWTQYTAEYVAATNETG